MFILGLKRRKDLSLLAATSLAASALFFIMTRHLIQYIAEHPENPIFRWLAALPVVALVALAVVAMRSLGRMDELERKMHTEAMAFAFLGSLLLISVYGFLTMADLLTFPALNLLPVMIICWITGLLLSIKRYR